jgi:hypothetical protein
MTTDALAVVSEPAEPTNTASGSGFLFAFGRFDF